MESQRQILTCCRCHRNAILAPEGAKLNTVFTCRNCCGALAAKKAKAIENAPAVVVTEPVVAWIESLARAVTVEQAASGGVPC